MCECNLTNKQQPNGSLKFPDTGQDTGADYQHKTVPHYVVLDVMMHTMERGLTTTRLAAAKPTCCYGQHSRLSNRV